MIRSLALTLCRLGARFRREDGAAAMEFVLVVPLLLMIFMASFESGLLMVRSILLEQSVDMTMREVRLGHLRKVSHHALKREICSRTIIFPSCMTELKIEMDRVSTANWDMPAPSKRCINRRAEAEPVQTMNTGEANDIMLIRVCIIAEAMFPTSGLALRLPQDQGSYELVTQSAFVVEPI